VRQYECGADLSSTCLKSDGYAWGVANQDGEFASRKLAALLRSEIEEGSVYLPGTKLPSYRRLGAQYGVAPNTVQAAMRLLEASGLVTIRPKSGAYVCDSAIRSTRHDVRMELVELRDQLQRTKQELAAAQQTVAGLIDRFPAKGPVE